MLQLLRAFGARPRFIFFFFSSRQKNQTYTNNKRKRKKITISDQYQYPTRLKTEIQTMLRSSTPVAPPKPRQNKLTQQRPSTVQKLETQDLISGLVWKQSSISSSRNANNGANSNRNVDLRWNAPKPKDVKVERFSERSSPTHNSNIPTSANNHTTSSYQSYPYPYQYQQQSQQSFTPFPITSSTPLPNASSAHEETYYPIPPSEYYYEPSFTYANNTLNTNACACASCQYPQMEAYAHPAHPDPNDLIRSMTSLSIHNGNAVVSDCLLYLLS